MNQSRNYNLQAGNKLAEEKCGEAAGEVMLGKFPEQADGVNSSRGA